MMKRLIFLIFLIPVVSTAQVDDKLVEKRMRKVSKRSVSIPEEYTFSSYHLTKYLTSETESDLEKIRAIYVWLANNITYDMIGFKSGNFPDYRPKAVLYNKAAVCEGYARLFAELCAEAGLRSEVIRGFSKGYGYEAGQQFEVSNHAWNAVYLDGDWKLIDVTWAARRTNENSIISPLNEEYFLTPPSEFIQDHLPEIPAWQLLSEPVSKAAFESSTISTTPGRYNFPDSLESLLSAPLSERTITYQLMARDFNPANDGANYELGLEYRYRGLENLEAIYKVEKPDTAIFNELERQSFANFNEAALYFTLIKPTSRYYKSAQVFLDDTDFERGVFKYEVAHRIIELYNKEDENAKKELRDETERLILKNYADAGKYFELIPRHSWYYEKAQEYLNEFLKNPFEPD